MSERLESDREVAERELRSLHVRLADTDCNGVMLEGCVACGDDWPCDTIRLLDERAELEAEVAKLKAELANADRCVLERENANGALDADNARLRDLLRWRKTSEEPPPEDDPDYRIRGKRWPYWRPLGPLPGDTK